MTTVRYRCPRCDTVVAMERDASLADKCVTPYPLAGWDYVSPQGDVESADGVRFVCGESPVVEWDGDGCGEPFYLGFVRFSDGVEVEPEPARETVRLEGPGPRGPAGPPGPG